MTSRREKDRWQAIAMRCLEAERHARILAGSDSPQDDWRYFEILSLLGSVLTEMHGCQLPSERGES